LSQYDLLVVGLFGNGGPVTVRLEDRPFVNQQLTTGAGWAGVAPGKRLRVTYLSIQEEDTGLYPRNMIYVVEV
jgi:hypothetical protein